MFVCIVPYTMLLFSITLIFLFYFLGGYQDYLEDDNKINILVGRQQSRMCLASQSKPDFITSHDTSLKLCEWLLKAAFVTVLKIGMLFERKQFTETCSRAIQPLCTCQQCSALACSSSHSAGKQGDVAGAMRRPAGELVQGFGTTEPGLTDDLGYPYFIF